jgi:hypothetical protein
MRDAVDLNGSYMLRGLVPMLQGNQSPYAFSRCHNRRMSASIMQKTCKANVTTAYPYYALWHCNDVPVTMCPAIFCDQSLQGVKKF